MKGLKKALLILLMGCTPSNGIVSEADTDRIVQYVSRSSSAIVESSRRAVVEISSFDEYGNSIKGSGAYVQHKGKRFILTAAHVVCGSNVAMVSNGDEKLIADVVYCDPDSDIAALKIEGMFTRQPLKWKTSVPSIGDDLLYTGNPNAFHQLTISGKASGHIGTNIVLHSYAWGGASGSVVLDMKGRIVGIVSAVDVGGGIIGPQIVEDIVIVVPIWKLKIDTLVDELSN